MLVETGPRLDLIRSFSHRHRGVTHLGGVLASLSGFLVGFGVLKGMLGTRLEVC